MTENLGYNPNDANSIVEYARKLVGHSLREVLDIKVIQSPKQRRGSWGNAVE